MSFLKTPNLNILILYFHTLKNIKPTQLYYQVYYRLRKEVWRFNDPKFTPDSQTLKFEETIPSYKSFLRDNQFNFLNKKHRFKEIDWNLSDYGKLWTYNLNYFDYLNQIDISKNEGEYLIKDFIDNKTSLKDSLEPYPISLRIINWTKFLSKHQINDQRIDQQLYSDCIRLTKSLEYHLLANHLLENGFGLLFGAYYFQDEKLYLKAKKIIGIQLLEQILDDGAHYELSPMYHQIILNRVLDSYNLVKSNDWQKDELERVFYITAQKMLSWLDNISFSNGEIPMVNDAAPGITPVSNELFSYAERLDIRYKLEALTDSGYRFYTNKNGFELFFDAGQISPSYQPGHSHADNLNIVLYYKGKPVIIDTGISTYEKNKRRLEERSTAAHNTLTVNNENSSQVWSGFRVGKRAYTSILHETENSIEALHNGYRHYGVEVVRAISVNPEEIVINDSINGGFNSTPITGSLHFAPNTLLNVIDSELIINGDIKLSFKEKQNFKLEDYLFAEGYNKLTPAKKLIYSVENKSATFSISKV